MSAFESNKRVFGRVDAKLRVLPLRMENISHADQYDDEDGEIKITKLVILLMPQSESTDSGKQ